MCPKFEIGFRTYYYNLTFQIQKNRKGGTSLQRVAGMCGGAVHTPSAAPQHFSVSQDRILTNLKKESQIFQFLFKVPNFGNFVVRNPKTRSKLSSGI